MFLPSIVTETRVEDQVDDQKTWKTKLSVLLLGNDDPSTLLLVEFFSFLVETHTGFAAWSTGKKSLCICIEGHNLKC